MSIQTFELSGMLDECDLALLNVTIASFDLNQEILFIGSTNGKVLKYSIASNNRKSAVFSTELLTTTQITHSPVAVKTMFYCYKFCVVLCVCDEQLHFLHSDQMQLVSSLNNKVKSVLCVAVNENPVNRSESASMEFVIGTSRKSVQLFYLTQDYRLSLLRQVSIADVPAAIAVDNWTVIVAGSNAYHLEDLKKSTSSIIFPFEKGSLSRPFVKRIGHGEFILNGPNALGVFANSQGVSQKPPLTWSRTTFAVSFCYPYVLALDDEFLTVHSILDQIQKQSIPSPGWSHLRETNGKVVVGSNRDLLVAMPLSEEQQITGLLAEGRVDEALVVLSNYESVTKNPTEDFYAFKHKIEQSCAFVKLKRREFNEARRLFLDSDLPIETLIAMWPSLSSNSKFKCKEINIDELCSKSPSNFTGFADFFTNMIMHYINQDKVFSECLDACAEILVNLYCKTDSVRLLALVEQKYFLTFDAELVLKLLKHNKQWHAAAIFCTETLNEVEASKIWRELIEGRISDALFPGSQVVVERASQFTNEKVLSDLLVWLCQQGSHSLVLPVLLDRVETSNNRSLFHPLNLCSEFDSFPIFVIDFLEKVYNNCDYNVNMLLCKRFQKQLHLNSKDLKIVCSHETTPELTMRERCRSFLETTTSLDLKEALNIFKQCTCCKTEALVLMRRLALHEEALDMILVDEIRDNFECAVAYCEKTYLESGEKLFERLLDRLSTSSLCIELIGRHGNKIRPIKTLQHIPDASKLKDANAHVTKALKCQASENCSRNLIKKAVVNVAHNYKMRELQIVKSLGPVIIDDDSTCAVCNGPFFESSFILLPTKSASSKRQIAHVSCMADC